MRFFGAVVGVCVIVSGGLGGCSGGTPEEQEIEGFLSETTPGELVEEFARLLEYYLGRHGKGEKPGHGLNDLIEQAKSEV